MFARQKTNLRSGRVYLQLVHSFRTRRGPRQRVVATLGRIDHVAEDRRPALLERVTAALAAVKPTRPKPRTKEELVAQGYGLDLE